MVSDNKHVVNQIVTLSKELLFVLFLLALVLVLKPTKASAATFNVATGSSATNADSICQLEEAIANINDGTRTNADCIETGAYGTDDTINLPVGTIDGSLSGSGLALLNNSTKIIGQGRGVSVVDDLAIGLFGNGTGVLEVSNLTMTGGGEGVGIGGIEADVTVNNVDIDLEGTGTTAIYTENSNLTVRDSYLHNSDMSGSGMGLISVYASSTNVTVNVERTTFAQGSRGINLEAGSGYKIDATIKNSTFTDLHGDANSMYQSGAGIGLFLGNNASNQINYITINNTFSNITNTVAGSYPATAIFEYAEDGTITHTAQNDLYAVGDGSSDTVNYFRPALSGSGDPLLGTFTTTSNGGNVSSDNSFGSRLNHATDQNNITTLASFLGTLGDNGGPVPTISLLANSPAIDSGTNVSGMTTDARGVTRPQGTAFDSGAYELEQSTPENPGGSESGSAQNTTTVVNPGLTSPTSSVSQFSNKPITISTPTGTTITSSNTVTESSLANQDGNNQYPLGLVNFTFNTSQTDNQVTLTFITDLKPNQVKPRKYNPDSKAYTDLTNYTLTETTINGQHALVLTYTITDNGDLDTNKTTGIISDPVGLAMSNSTYDQLANTGQESLIAGLVAGLTMIAGSIALITTRLKDKVRYSFKR